MCCEEITTSDKYWFPKETGAENTSIRKKAKPRNSQILQFPSWVGDDESRVQRMIQYIHALSSNIPEIYCVKPMNLLPLLLHALTP
jgi:hypothetical protein